jgi:hypothetical protein
MPTSREPKAATPDPVAQRVEEMLGMLRKFRSDALTEFGESSPLADLLSDRMIGWFTAHADEKDGRTADVLDYLTQAVKREGDLLEVNSRLRDQIVQVTAERGNLERTVVEVNEKKQARINELTKAMGDLLPLAHALYGTVGRLRSRATSLRELVVTSWLAGLKIEPEAMRQLVFREADELNEILDDHVDIMTRDWFAEGTAAPPASNYSRSRIEGITEVTEEHPPTETQRGKVVEGEVRIEVKMPRRLGEALMASPPRTAKPCPPDCATMLGHSHAFDGDGDAG